MKDRLRDLVVRQYEPLGRNHAKQREKLMASIPHAVPERQSRRRHRIRRLLAGDNAQTITERIFKMNRIPRIAAAIIVVATVAGIAAFLTLGNGGASITWADVQQRIRNARTMTFKIALKTKGLPDNMESEIKVTCKEPGLMRQEYMIGSGKTIAIYDRQKKKLLLLWSQKKKAIVSDMTTLSVENLKKYEGRNFLNEIKKLIEKSETELGEKQIDGRAVKGYRVEQGNQAYTLWADAKTGQLNEVKMTMFQGETEIILSDIEFDVKLDKSLFSLDVPKGYTVEKRTMYGIPEASIANVIVILRKWVKVRGGTFPDAFTPANFEKDCNNEPGEFKETGFAKAKVVKVYMANMVRTMMQLTFTQHGEAYYTGKGVKLGEADKAVFWYKPIDSETYKVIYGDLSVKDVAEEDLPTKPEDKAGSE